MRFADQSSQLLIACFSQAVPFSLWPRDLAGTVQLIPQLALESGEPDCAWLLWSKWPGNVTIVDVAPAAESEGKTFLKSVHTPE